MKTGIATAEVQRVYLVDNILVLLQREELPMGDKLYSLAEEFGVTEDVVRFRMGLPDVRGLGLGIE